MSDSGTMNGKNTEVICLQCPLACRIAVAQNEKGEITELKGWQCKRGEAYARQEVISPVRVLTTTVRIESRDKEHPLLPVQTENPIPKGLLLPAMRALAAITAKAPVKYGQVVYADILGTGINVIATTEVTK